MSFIPYQIDYKVVGAGKTLGISKKRITFKFGFANRKALEDRLTGAACRGSEHEVVLIMSLASGKRHVLLDGREVHFSQGEKMQRTFDFPFSIRIPNVGQVQARLVSDHVQGPNPYHFYINGMSYFHFSKIYELGTPAMRVGQMHQQRSYTNHSELEASAEERRLIAQAKLESMRELREQQERDSQKTAESNQMKHDEGNLINFDDVVVGQAPPAVPQQGGMMYQASSLTMDPALQQSQSFTQSAPAPAPTGAAYTNYSISTSQMSAPPPQSQAQYGYAGTTTSTAQTTSTQYSQPITMNTSMVTQYSQPPPAAASYAQAPSPYAQAPPPAATSSYSSTPQQPSQYGYPPQSAPAPTYEETQQSFTPAQQQQFASPQTQASYGSAPAFAQPPARQASSSSHSGAQPPAGTYGAYPNTGSGW